MKRYDRAFELASDVINENFTARIHFMKTAIRNFAQTVQEWITFDSSRLRYWFWLGVGITLSIFLLRFYLAGFGVFGDGLGYYTPLRSLLFDGDLRVANEYAYYSQSASNFGGGMRVPGPIPEYSKYTLGLGFVLLPFFALGHLLALVLQGMGQTGIANGMTWPYELMYCLGSISLGLTGLVLAYKMARRFWGETASAIAVGGIWFASPLTYYLCLEVSMSHAVSSFLVALFLYLSLTRPWIQERRFQIGLGIILGLAAWVRPQDSLFLVVPVLLGWLGTEQKFDKRETWQLSWQKLKHPDYLRAIFIIISVAALMQLPQMLIYLWQYGGLTQIPYLEEGKARGYGNSFHWLQPALWQVLFSGHRGLFVWHPLTLFSIIGLGWATRSLPRLASSLLVAFALQVYFIASWWCWWQGASVGGRMFANCSFLFVLGLAYLWQQFPSNLGEKTAIAITLFLAFWNVLIILQYQSAMIPPEEAITLKQLYQNQWQVIPFFLEHLLKKV